MAKIDIESKGFQMDCCCWTKMHSKSYSHKYNSFHRFCIHGWNFDKCFIKLYLLLLQVIIKIYDFQFLYYYSMFLDYKSMTFAYEVNGPNNADNFLDLPINITCFAIAILCYIRVGVWFP